MAKKKKKKKNGSGSGCLIVGIVAGVLLLCCTGSIGIGGAIAWQQGLFSKAGSASPAAKLLNYPNTRDGMKQQMEDIMKEHETGGDAKMKESLAIPPRWFEEHFGPERGKKLAEQYKQKAGEREKKFHGDLRIARFSKENDVEVQTHDLRKIDKAVAGILVKDIQVYSVDRWHTTANGQSGNPVGHFVYIDGAFRFLETRDLRP